MGPLRSKKRRPTFRRLLKTSGMKLENKMKNRQMKQQNVAKKQRKEQKRLRQAMKGASLQMPRPLETYRKRPEEEEEEEFLDSLPTDMMDDADLEQLTAMAQKASFITRDLSSCGPVHSGKKRSADVVRGYEKVPRKMARVEEKEMIQLLPIKDKSGVIPRSMEKVKPHPKDKEEEENDEEPAETAEQQEEEGASSSYMGLTPEERERYRVHTLKMKKQRIASLASAIISDPLNNTKRMKELRGMMMESDPSVAVSVRKMVMVSLMEVFKDIAPTYKIRPLTAAEKSTKVKKETQQLREFEESLVSQYKFYLEDLEQTIKDWKQKKRKRVQAVSFQSYRGLAEVSIRCLCELLLTMPHFNFHNNIIVVLVPLMNDPLKKVSDMCCDAFKKLFQDDRMGGASLATVRVISGLVKSLNYNIKPEVLRTLLSLRIKEVEMKRDLEATAPKKKFMTNKERKKNLSRMQRKVNKAGVMTVILFPSSFAHLINLEFFDDLLKVLQNLIQSGDLTNRESLHCIQTVFTILSGQGEALNIDPLNFYSQLYRILMHLHAGAPNDDVTILLRCLDAMLTRRRKQVTLQRAMAFVKRLSTLSLHVLPNASVGILAANRATMHAFPKCDFLLDNEIQGSGFYLPELDEPEHCNAQNSALWELHPLQRHFHPVVQLFARHLSRGAPSDGSGALSLELCRRSPMDLFADYSVKDMTFNPAVASPPSKKKDKFVVGASLLDDELQKQVDCILKMSEDTKLDFAKARH
ncbi:PREDICTED: nucleolar complex protein 3 homolog [Cyprinodon variegatus]|uniref:nucleolar complex protein 3 homolog n=1 Tax=Cyprinodon variegatus TaxID=28743 RepID=UPI000742B2DD|nr:PREDICTED: nucleolar complex protein 3 homolog [Cyprinodon variegatus]